MDPEKRVDSNLSVCLSRCYSETRSASVKIECNADSELMGEHEENMNMMLLQPPSPPYTAVAAITQVSLSLQCFFSTWA